MLQGSSHTLRGFYKNLYVFRLADQAQVKFQGSRFSEPMVCLFSICWLSQVAQCFNFGSSRSNIGLTCQEYTGLMGGSPTIQSSITIVMR